MSRGLGHTQVGILLALRAQQPQTLRQLASRIYGEEPPSRAGYVATARALRNLARRGWASTDGRWRCRVMLTPSARLALYLATHNAAGVRQVVGAGR